MSSSSVTPAIDELRARGDWSPDLDTLAEWDPDWTERTAQMVNNPWTTGILPVKWIELICIALNAACTHRNQLGVQRHVRAALRAGATRDEILDTFKGVSVLGIHSVAVSLPILFEEAAAAGVEPAPHRSDTSATPVIDQLKATGLFNQTWDPIHQLDPRWLEEFLAMGAEMYSGSLPTKLVELMAIAVDASCTHLYTPGIRRHIQRALAQGASMEEIMEVLKLCGALGVEACELGTPILAQELTNQPVT
ncbi:MAG TPA: carboxymuconolactone decarboxylase family protein [Propionibacteriaceae bacterium]|nr:carboxymuconolactone decarboxylase family protein [Propionibacteriaceae bacterium]